MPESESVSSIQTGQDSSAHLLVGYGTLLSRQSVALTVDDSTLEELDPIPVIVNGYRRLFDIRPPHYEPSFRLSERPIEAGAMNVEPRSGASFNGLAFELSSSTLEAMDERESHYERVRIDIEAFRSRRELRTADVYSAPPSCELIRRDPQNLLPRWRDVVISRRAAYRISDEFGKTFDRTTYLADGETLVIERYREHLPPVD